MTIEERCVSLGITTTRTESTRGSEDISLGDQTKSTISDLSIYYSVYIFVFYRYCGSKCGNFSSDFDM